MRRIRKLRAALAGWAFLVVTGVLIWASQHRNEIAETKPSRQQHQRLLCFVPADPNRVSSSLSVKETWGSRCDALLFFSSKAIPQLMPNVVVLTDRSEGYYRLWGKVRGIWKHLRSQHLDDFDWFLKADDDTYIVVDNLRSFLERRLSSTNAIAEGVWFGARLKNPKVTGGYHSGGAGYVLSRRALELFDDGRHCSQMNFGYEDLEMGRCLEKVGVQVVDTRDSTGLATFLPFSPEELLLPRRPDNIRFNDPLGNGDSWYWKTVWWPHQLGRNCCSSHVISFHHVKPKMMYAMDFLIYSLKLDR